VQTTKISIPRFSAKEAVNWLEDLKYDFDEFLEAEYMD
jgi:hypothetical protein